MNPAQKLLEKQRRIRLGKMSVSFKTPQILPRADAAEIAHLNNLIAGFNAEGTTTGRTASDLPVQSNVPKSDETLNPNAEYPVGTWGGLCNRKACRRPGAYWWNRGSYSHYCTQCARELNRLNWRDAEELLGVGEKLCILMNSAEHHPLSQKFDVPNLTGHEGFRY